MSKKETPISDKLKTLFMSMVDKATESVKTPTELMKVVTKIGLGYLGANAFKHWTGWLYGMLAYDLATTPVTGESNFGVKILGSGVEIPINSQVVGITMLGVLGAIPVFAYMKDVTDPMGTFGIPNPLDRDPAPIDVAPIKLPWEEESWCPKGFYEVVDEKGNKSCRRIEFVLGG